VPRFLIARLSSLGDVVCTLPVAAALRRANPDAHIAWVVDPRFRAVVEACAAVDEVIATKPSLRNLPSYDAPFDAAFDMQGLLKSGLAVWRAKAPVKLGYHWQREGAQFFSQWVLPDPSSIHIVDQYVDVARAYGAEADRAEFMLTPRVDTRDKVDGDYIVINAGAGWATKRWPVAHVASLTKLIQSAGAKPVLIGGKADEDRAVAQEVRDAGGDFRDLVGETNIAELIDVIARARAHVGGDTGSTHIAAALGVRAVGLYSITRPERSCPYGQIDNCLYEPSGLASIAPESVMAKLALG